MPSLLTQKAAKALTSFDFDFIRGPHQAALLARRLQEIEAYAGPVGVDTETTGLDPHVNQVRLVQIGTPEYALVVDLNGWRSLGERAVAWDAVGMRDLRRFLQGSKPKVLQNAAFDLNFLCGEGVVLGGNIFDTMIAAKIINNGSGHKNDLGSIVSRNLKVELPKELQKADWAGEITAEMLQYAARDVVCLPLLVPVLTETLQSKIVKSDYTLKDLFGFEMRVVKPIALMQWYGFGFDKEGAEALKVQLVAEAEALKTLFLEHLDKEIRERKPDDPHSWLPRDPDGSINTREKDSGSIRLGTKLYKGFNPRSAQQMAERFEQAGIILPPDEKGKPSLDQNLLAFLRSDYELIDQYMTWKTAVTKVSNIEKLLESVGPDGRIHCNYRQMGTETGRLSAASPNLQQVNRGADFRSKFVAAPGHQLVVADFSQVELRVAAFLSGEQRMLDAYLAGRDLHTETAALMAGVDVEQVTKAQRQSAKVCFSADTEVLTPDGWVTLANYQGQQVAQYVLPAGVELNRQTKKPGPGYTAGLPASWDGNCGRIEFVDTLDYQSFYSDDVWESCDRNTSVVATANHEIFYIDAHGNAHKKALTEVVCPRSFVAAGYLQKGVGIGATRSRVLAMVVADGSFKQTDGWVSLGFSKRRKIFRCMKLLEEAGIAYRRDVYSNGRYEKTTFFKFRINEAEWLYDYVDRDKKLCARRCLADVDALAYLAEAQYWDGYSIEGKTRDRVIVTTAVRETADVMQAMAVTAGLPCTVHTDSANALTGCYYRVSYAFRTTPTWRVSWEPKPVEPQHVFCVQVPSGLVLIRHRGRVSVQGNCNFGLLYGAGPATLRKQAIAQYGIDMDMTDAKDKVELFRSAYPTLYKWQQEEGSRTTPAVFTALGRRRLLSGFNDKYTTRINTQVQGTAGDIAKLAIAKLWTELRKAPDEARLIAMVHDEIVLEVREDCVEHWSQVLKGSMEAAGGEICPTVPIVAEVSSGPTWADAK